MTSERARAAALIAERKRAAAARNGSSIASETPRSEAGSDWGSMYNKKETQEAQERRASSGWGQQHAPRGSSGWGRSDGGSSAGGWADQKRKRDDRERGGPRDRRW